eukprot:494706-Amphidinium_carterae.1
MASATVIPWCEVTCGCTAPTSSVSSLHLGAAGAAPPGPLRASLLFTQGPPERPHGHSQQSSWPMGSTERPQDPVAASLTLLLECARRSPNLLSLPGNLRARRTVWVSTKPLQIVSLYVQHALRKRTWRNWHHLDLIASGGAAGSSRSSCSLKLRSHS